MAIAPTQTDSISEVAGRVRFVDLTQQIRDLRPMLTDAIEDVVMRGDFILGAEVSRFEEEFATFCGVPEAVGLDSGYSALELGLRAAGVGPGDEVITQANTFVATVSAIRAAGATPILVDCDAHGSFDPAAIAAAIGPKTAAVIPVHLFGRIGPIDEVVALARKHSLLVFEDACQAHGATLGGRRAGSFGDLAAFSFYPGKNLGAFGDAGMLVTRRPEIARKARMFRHYGQRVKYEHELTPLNRRLDTIQAAVLLVKLPHLDGWSRRRALLAQRYSLGLAAADLWTPPAEEPGRHVYHLYVIETSGRDRLQRALGAAGIDSGIHYPIPLHLQPALSDLGYAAGSFPLAERLAEQSLSLPMYPELPVAAVDRVVAAVVDTLRTGP